MSEPISKGQKHKPREEKPHQADAFDLWYSQNRDFKKTQDLLRLNTPPVNVSLDTLYRWATSYNWQARAKERDVAVEKLRTEKAIEAQIEFIKRKGNYGKLLQKRALEFLNKSVIDPVTGKPILGPNGQPVPIDHVTNASTAVQLLQVGVLYEQQALGLPEWIVEAMTADDETLRRIYSTALSEFASIADTDDAEGDAPSTFPAIALEPVQKDSNGSK